MFLNFAEYLSVWENFPWVSVLVIFALSFYADVQKKACIVFIF